MRQPLYHATAVALLLLAGCGAPRQTPPSGTGGAAAAEWARWARSLERVAEDTTCAAVAAGRIPEAWLRYAELSQREADHVEECQVRFEAAMRDADSVLALTGLEPHQREVRERRQTLVRAAGMARARRALQALLGREFRLTELTIRIRDDGFDHDTRWNHSVTLNRIANLTLDAAAMAVPEYSHEALRLAAEWAPIDASIATTLRQRAAVTRELGDFLAIRASEEVRGVVTLLDEINERGIFIDTERDYAHPTTSRRRPVIKHSTGANGDATGLSHASTFSSAQLDSQNQVLDRADWMREIAAKVLSPYTEDPPQGVAFLNQLRAQEKGAALLRRYIEARRLECEALRLEGTLKNMGARFAFDHFSVHATVTVREAVTAKPQQTLAIVKRLRATLEALLMVTDGADFGGAYFARYQAYPSVLQSWLRQEIASLHAASRAEPSRR